MQFNEAVPYEKDGVRRFAATPTEKMQLEFSGWKKVEEAVKAAAAPKSTATRKPTAKNNKENNND